MKRGYDGAPLPDEGLGERKGEYRPQGREYEPPGAESASPAREVIPPGCEYFPLNEGLGNAEARRRNRTAGEDAPRRKKTVRRLARSMGYCVAAAVSVVTLSGSLKGGSSSFPSWGGSSGVVENNAVSCVTSALTGAGIPSATITVHRGTRTGAVERTVRCDSAGTYSLRLPEGLYVLEIKASGYMTEYFTREVYEWEDYLYDRYTLSPELGPGQFRIVLEWGDHPNDLDSHLVGQTDSGTPVNVFYGTGSAYEYTTNGVDRLVAMLDRDDTDCYGPETTTIYVAEGSYSFLVHDFTNGETADSLVMNSSGATVKLYQYGTEAPRTYTVPYGQGTWWHVFDIDHGVVRTVNSRTVSEELKTAAGISGLAGLDFSLLHHTVPFGEGGHILGIDSFLGQIQVMTDTTGSMLADVIRWGGDGDTNYLEGAVDAWVTRLNAQGVDEQVTDDWLCEEDILHIVGPGGMEYCLTVTLMGLGGGGPEDFVLDFSRLHSGLTLGEPGYIYVEDGTGNTIQVAVGTSGSLLADVIVWAGDNDTEYLEGAVDAWVTRPGQQGVEEPVTDELVSGGDILHVVDENGAEYYLTVTTVGLGWDADQGSGVEVAGLDFSRLYHTVPAGENGYIFYLDAAGSEIEVMDGTTGDKLADVIVKGGDEDPDYLEGAVDAWVTHLNEQGEDVPVTGDVVSGGDILHILDAAGTEYCLNIVPVEMGMGG